MKIHRSRGLITSLMFILGLNISLSHHLEVHASPDQAWEDFALATDQERWIASLPEGSPQRIYFEILYAQSRGDWIRSEELLKLHKDREGLSDLRARQLILTLSESSGSDSWYALRELAHLTFPREAYQPPQRSSDPQDEAIADATKEREARLTQDELARAFKEFEERQGAYSLTTQGVIHRLSQTWGNVLTESEEDQLKLLLDKLNYLAPDELIDLLRRLPVERWESSSLLNQLSDLDLKGLIATHSLSSSAQQRIFKRILTLTSRAHEAGFKPYRLSSRDFDQYLEELNALVAINPDRHQSFKAHLLLAELYAAERRGEWPIKPLLSYLKIPQDYQHYQKIYEASLSGDPAEVTEPYISTYDNPTHLRMSELRSYQNATGLGLKEPPSVLIARHIEHHLTRARDVKRFSAYLDKKLLNKMWAKRRYLSGGEMRSKLLKRYLKSEDYQKLSALKLLRFTSTVSKLFKRDEEVKLTVRSRGYQELSVNIYPLNMRAYWKRTQALVPIDLDLSGLEANQHRKIKISDAQQLTLSSLSFPELSDPGAYVIDIQAGDEKIRGVIHKGNLTPYVIDTESGPELLVVDDLGALARDVEISLDGRSYSPEPSGRFRIPYRDSSGSATLLIHQGDLTVRSRVTVPSEEYQLHLHVSAPQLRGGAENSLKLHGRLTLNQRPLPLALLKQLVLNVQVIGADGTPQSKVIPAPPFDQAGELVLPIQLPLGLSEVKLSLSGEITSLTRGKKRSLRANEVSLQRNQDLASRNVGDLLFVPGGETPRLEIIGRSGEPLRGVEAKISLSPKRYHSPLQITKRSDSRGYINLPKDLSDFHTLSAQIQVEGSDRARAHDWPLEVSTVNHPLEMITARAHEELTFMWSGSESVYLRHAHSLRSLNRVLTTAGGVMRVQPLSAGEYEIVDVLKQKVTKLRVFPTAARLKDELWFTSHGIYPHASISKMTLEELKADDRSIVVRVNHPSKRARLHLVATPYGLDEDTSLSQTPLSAPSRPRLDFTDPESLYGVGQVLSEEMRYILKRQKLQSSHQQIGNVSASPSLLINRSDQGEVESVDRPMASGSSIQGYGGGAGYGRRMNARPRSGRYNKTSRKRYHSVDQSVRSWDFLKRGVATRWGIPVNSEAGWVGSGDSMTLTISLEKLRGAGRLHLILVDDQQSVSRVIPLMGDQKARDLWLERADLRAPLTHSTPRSVSVIQREQRSVRAEDQLTLPDLSSRWKSYETLESVYDVYQRLLPNARLERLKKLISWPSLTEQDRLKLYSELGSHEVDLFIFHKDPTFFKAHIRPLLRQKGYRSFLEQWMLNQDLSDFLAPHRFETLNLLERILLLKRAYHKAQGEERQGLKRYVEQLLSAQPVSQARIQSLFQTAIAPSLDRSAPRDQAPAESVLIELGAKSVESFALPTPASAPAPESESAEPAPMMDEDDTAVYSLQEKRARAPQLYQGEGATHQWIERRYFDHATPPQGLISINRFWVDYALHDRESGPFLSPYFLEAATNFNSAWLALALLDLPFSGEPPQAEVSEGKLKISARSAGLYFYEGAMSQEIPDSQDVSIRREYWTLDRNGSLQESGPRELRAGIPYQVKLMVMNPTNRRVSYEMSHPLPDGAMLLLTESGARTLTPQVIKLAPYEIKMSGYTIYFPHIGEFQHPPAYVTQAGELIGAGSADTLQVVRELTQLNQESWSDVARLGDHETVIKFLSEHNPREVNLNAIYNRLPDPTFYRALITLLSGLNIFDRTVWSFALFHRDLKRARELFTLNPSIRSRLEPYARFTSLRQRADDEKPSLEGQSGEIDLYAQLGAQHFDFDPLTVARAHSRGKISAMTHTEMKSRYLSLLKYLAHKPRAHWSLYDHLGVTYYLVKQGRLSDATIAFERAQRLVERSGASTAPSDSQMYYDYLRAYLAMSQGDVKGAQEVAQAYQGLTYEPWRARFKSVYAPEALDPKSHVSDREAPSLSESLNFKIEGATLIIKSHKLTSAELRLYPIDLEVLFSNNPVALEDSEVSVSPLVKPSFVQTISLSERGETRYDLPNEWRGRALRVEVRHATLSQIQPYSPQSFTQHVFPQRGLLRVIESAESHMALSGTYIKVYVKLKSGEVRFYKDGYTDYRGVFDYLNANPAPDLKSVERVFILTLTKEHGSSVTSVAPPAH